MNMIKLQSGSFIQDEAKPSEDLKSLEKKALLVYCGKFNSMDGEVEINDEHIEKLAAEHNALLSKVSRLASGELPIKHCPPIQLDHSTSAKDTVGRLVGDIEVGEYDDNGKKVKALYGKMKILGKENVEKVQDGRWTHLSIGADLDTGKLSELTITPFPAAPNASMLSKESVKNLKLQKWSVRLPNGEDIEVNAETEEEAIEKAKSGKGKQVGTYKDKIKKPIAEKLQKEEKMSKLAKASFYGKYKNVEFTIMKDGGKYFIKINGQSYGKMYSEEREAVIAAKQIIDETKLQKGDTNMFEKLMKFLTGTKRMAEGEAVKEVAKMTDEEKAKLAKEAEESEKKMKLKKHLMDKEKLTDEDAEKKLAEMPDEEKAKLEAECDEELKKLAEKETEESKAKMTSAKGKLTKLAGELKINMGSTKLAAKKADLSVRLSKLKAEAKITPAELKKINLSELATKSESAITDILKTYESREPVILTGVYGSTKGVNTASLYKEAKLKKMEKDILSAMPFTRMALGEKEEQGAQDTVNVHIDTDPHTDLSEVQKMADEHHKNCLGAMDGGKLEEAKEHLKKLMDHCKKHLGSVAQDPVNMEEAQTQMSALAENIEKLQNQCNEYLKLIEEVTK